MQPTAATTWKHLERDPLSKYKQLSIKGRRIFGSITELINQNV